MDFAGSWYPAGADACRQAIREFEAAESPAAARLGVAPHAGWLFSGRLAALVYQSLAAGGEADLVIVLGGHLRGTDALRVMGEGAWATPFGAFRVHMGFNRCLTDVPNVVWETPADYEADNSTELQLPFARLKFPQSELLAMRVPPSPVALLLGERLVDYLKESGLRAVAIASTDLTHYGPNYRFEPRGRGAEAVRWVREENDPAFIRAVESGPGQAVLDVTHQRHCACSGGGVAVLAEVARRQGLHFVSLGYGTSAESRHGDATNFVGYLAGVWR